MKKYLMFLTVLVILSIKPIEGEASPNPCRFSSIKDVYHKAELAVIGHVIGSTDNGFDLRFQITSQIKGKADGEIILRGQRPLNTEYNGFSIKQNLEVFLLLIKSPDGIYDSPEDYNSPCNVLNIVKDGEVDLYTYGTGFVSFSLDQLKDYLEK